jgi:hypothetical protein
MLMLCAETQDAAELVHRIIRAQNRFAKVRRRSGHVSYVPFNGVC